MKLNYYEQLKNALNGLVDGIKQLFPIESNRRELKLVDVSYDLTEATEKAREAFEHTQLKLNEKSLTIPIYGTLELIDKETGKVIDRSKKKLVDAPVLTMRNTFMIDGNDYSITKQLRLKPGIYTRIKENGDLESFFNLEKGGRVKLTMKLNPESNTFTLGMGNSNPKLYPILKALGMSDAELQKMWGKQLLELNKTTGKSYIQNLRKAYKAVLKSKAKADATEAEMIAGIKEFFDNTKVSPVTTKITLGEEFDKVNRQALLKTSKKLLDVSRGDVKPDARDSLYFKNIFNIDELLKARLKAFKYEINKKVKNNLDKKSKISEIFNKEMLNKPVHSFITQSGLSTVSEAVNPVALLNAATKTTIMGEGGLGSLDAVTTAMRSVDPSQAGYLDPIHTPESNKIGINLHLTTASEINNNELYTPLYNVKTKTKEKLSPLEMIDKNVAFPDQYDFKNNKWKYEKIRVNRKGEMHLVDPKDVDYVIPKATGMYSLSSNLMPFLANTQGNRAMMGNKMFGQALSLVGREEPLVKIKWNKSNIPGSDGSFENNLRRTYGVRATIDGTVTKVGNNAVVIRGKNGELVKHGLYRYFPLANKSYIHSEPIVKPGDKVKKGQILADDNFSRNNSLALGTNLNVAYIPYKDKSFEDGIPISERAAKKLTSTHLYMYSEKVGDSDIVGASTFKKQFPGLLTADMERKLGPDGIIKEDIRVEPNDIMVPILKYREPSIQDQVLGKLSKSLVSKYRDASIVWDHDFVGHVIRAKKIGDKIIVHVRAERPAEIGDKLAGRYGNKGVITAIIPDDEMPKTKDGEIVDMIITPLSVQGRINTGQIAETVAGKVAKKRGRPVKIENFADFKSDEELKKLAKQHGVNIKEDLYDPKTGRKIATASMGPAYVLKLQHMVEKKMTARSPRAPYNSDLQPTKGGKTSARSMDRLTWNSLISHGARENLREMSVYKSERNPELWNAVRLGLPLPAPKTPFVVNKMFDLMAAGGINVKKDGDKLQLVPITDKDILEKSNGEIDDAQVVMAKNLRPIKDGLFDDTKTGGLIGTKWTHIKLQEPIPNPVMEKPIKAILDLSSKDFDALMSGAKVYNVKTKQLENGEPNGKDLLTGGNAVKEMLKNVNVDKALEDLRSQAVGQSGTALDKINKKMRYLTALKNLKTKPDEAYILHNIPVLPPKIRPMYALPDGTIVSSPINFLYRDAIMVNKELKDSKNLPDSFKTGLRKDLYNAVKAVQGLGAPIIARKEKSLKGALQVIAGDRPKTGFFQSTVFSKKQELTGTSTIAPSSDINPDDVLLPKEMAWNIFEPFTMKELISMGYPAMEAAQMVASRDKRAEMALHKAVSKRPVWITRAPSLHKFNILAVKPKLYEGNAIKLHPLIFTGFNADNDGDSCLDSVYLVFTEKLKKDLLLTLNNSSIKVADVIKQRRLSMPHIDKLPFLKGKTILHFNLEDFPRLEYTKRVTDTGVIEYDVPDGIEILTLNNERIPVSVPVTKFSIHPDLENYIVTLNDSTSLWLSDDHSAIVYDTDTNKLVKCKPQNLIGKAIPKVKHLNITPSLFEVELSTYYEKDKYSVVDKRQLDEEFGHFIGMLIGDGNIVDNASNKQDSYFINTNPDLTKAFHKSVMSLLKKESAFAYEKSSLSRSNKNPVIPTKNLAQNIGNWIGYGDRDKHLPPFYLSSPIEFRLGLLAGLLDTDGSVSYVKKSGKSGRFVAKYTTQSERLAQEILTLTRSLGVKTGISFNKEYTLIFSVFDMHTLKIKLRTKSKAMALYNFRKQPISESSFAAIQSKFDLIPYHRNMTKTYLKALPKAILPKDKRDKEEFSLYCIIKKAEKTGIISKYSMLKIKAKMMEAGLEFPKYVDDLINDDSVTWTYVKKIKRNPRKITMYDITAPGPYTFMVSSGIIVQDTMGAYVPITQSAVDEAYKFTPSKILESPRTGSVMLEPTKDIQVELFAMTVKGQRKNKSFPNVEAAKKDFYANKIDLYDIVNIGGKSTTLGRALLEEVLPKDIKIPEEGLNNTNVGKFLKDLTLKHRSEFNEIMGKIIKLVTDFGYQSNVSLGLDDLSYENKIMAPIKKELKTKFNKLKTKEERIKFLTKLNDKLTKANKEWANKNVWKNDLAFTQLAAGKPGFASLKQLKFAPLIFKDPHGQVLDMPVTRSYANGLTSSDYWAASYGARSGMIDRALQTSEPGYFAKQLLSVVGDQVISMEDCGTKDGVMLDPKTEDQNEFIGRYEAGTNRLIDTNYYQQIYRKGVPIKVRSPLTCEAAHGVCSKCYGHHESGAKAQIGDNVGMLNGQTITERGTQLTMRTFHTGAVVESGTSYSTSGMTRIRQLTNLPEYINKKAALATVSGRVSKVEPNPAGGVNITVNGVNHFGIVNKPLVKVGDYVKKGDKLTEGTIQPKELLKLNGIRKTQDHLIEELRKAYKSQGINVNRRAFETVVRGTTNTTQIIKPAEGSGYLPGDKVALTKVLAWNREHPNNPIQHQPVLMGIDFAAKVGNDWIKKLNTTRLFQVLEEGAAKGEYSPIHSYNPVTPYVIGTSFGKGPDGKY